MPTYAYECQDCGHGFEKFQSMSANSLRRCPECGKRKLQRLIGPGAALIFKGSGFYETDYRSESYKKDASADKESAAKSDSGDKPKSKTEKTANSGEKDAAKDAAKPAKDAKKES
jgi:putative FmdB family regulatory protein